MARRKRIPTPIKKEIRRVIKYRRYSRDREYQTTMHTQNEAIERHCEYKKWQVVADLGDPGRSAFNGDDRPDFDRSIEMIERGQADAVVVFKIDRYARNIGEFWDAWQRIKAAGGSFISISEDFDTSTSMGELMLLLIAGFAQMESQMKSERAIPMHQHQKEMGYVGPGSRPYGYDKMTANENKRLTGKNGARLTMRRNEAKVIRDAAEWIIAGNGLKGFIAKHSPDSSQPGKKMTYRGLKQVLTNPTTAGMREWAANPDGSGFKQGNWEGILTHDQWTQLRTILLDPSRHSGAPIKYGRHYLLSGVMRCQTHNKAVFNQNWNDPKTKVKIKKYKCPDCWTSVHMTIADELALTELFDRVPESKWQVWQSSGKGWDASLIESLESRMRFVDKQFTTGKLTESRYLDMMGDLEEELNATHNEEPLDIPHVPNLREAWPTFSLDDKQRVLRQAFPTIEMVPFAGTRDPAKRIQFA